MLLVWDGMSLIYGILSHQIYLIFIAVMYRCQTVDYILKSDQLTVLKQLS